MKVTVRERAYIGNYKCIDREMSFHAQSYWQAEGTNILYFRTNQFNVKAVSKEDLIRIEEEVW